MARIAYCVAQKRCKACVNDKVHTEVVERQGKGDKSTTTLSCRDTPRFVTKECQINFLLYNRLPRPPPILPLPLLLLLPVLPTPQGLPNLRLLDADASDQY